MLDLYLLRHAKSSRSGFFKADISRPLNRRGRSAARLMGRHMAAEGISPDLVLCSPARRTRETLDGLSEDLPEGVIILFEDALYSGAAGDYLALLRQHGGTHASVLLIGHNPAMEELARALIAGGDDTARADMAAKFPTGALAHIAFETADWSGLAVGSGNLVSFTKPREL